MPNFHTSLTLNERQRFPLDRSEDCQHLLRVRRVKMGARVDVYDSSRTLWRCSVTAITEDGGLELQAEERLALVPGPALEVTVFQAVQQGAKFDLCLELAGTFGARAVQPMATQKSIFQLSGKKPESKMRRWQAILDAQAKQTQRPEAARILPPLDFPEALASAERCDQLIFGHFSERAMAYPDFLETKLLSKRPLQLGLFIGPESGFAEAECVALREAGAVELSFGPWVYRSELAVAAALAPLAHLALI